MFVSDCLGVNEIGHLTIGQIDTVELAQTYGTPLYVMDENQIRHNCQSYKKSIDEFYNSNGLVAYASKAFSCKAMYKIAMEENIGIDVVSGGELHTAKSVGFPCDKIIFHGNNKTAEELISAIEYGVGRIVVDNLSELNILNEIAKSMNKKVSIMIRIKPGIDAHTHDFVRTGQIDSKFGFAIETGEAFNAVKTILTMDNVNLLGIHCHIGSQIFDIDPFELTSEVMLKFMIDVRDNTGLMLSELNLGGGFGIKYLTEQNPAGYSEYMKKVSFVVKKICEKNNFPVPFIILEPGRTIVGSAGITLYKVGAVKEIPNIRTYVSIDGGLTDNPRYALYKAEYEIIVANKADKPYTSIVTLAGKCCESGDLIGENMHIQDVQDGDIIAVFSTGAYNYSMASNYNRIPKPAVVMIKDKKDRVIVKRESLDDLIKNDLL